MDFAIFIVLTMKSAPLVLVGENAIPTDPRNGVGGDSSSMVNDGVDTAALRARYYSMPYFTSSAAISSCTSRAFSRATVAKFSVVSA